MLFTKSILNLTKRVANFDKKHLKTSPILHLFYEKDDKCGYGRYKEEKDRKLPPLKERMREGLKELKHEIALWKEEMKDRYESDPVLIFRDGETDVVWNFDNEDSLKTWVVTSDSDHGEGYSQCSLTLTKQRKGLFAGDLCTRVPLDGKIKRAGYCNIGTVRARKSFKRDTYLDWTSYNTLVMRVRGDGRSYLLNIATKGYFDMMWNDIYHFVLYTRGGPYWQTTKIPLSKFFMASKGRVQDRQYPLPLNKITSFGITAGDKVNGPFSLEIDYIGLEDDPNHIEEFAYEMYKVPKYVPQT